MIYDGIMINKDYNEWLGTYYNDIMIYNDIMNDITIVGTYCWLTGVLT